MADVAEPKDPAIAERDRLEAIAKVESAQAKVDLYRRAQASTHVALKNSKAQLAQLEFDISCELINLGGVEFETESIVSSLKTRADLQQRIAIYTVTVGVVTEMKLPEAQAALYHAQADLKPAAADLIDAKRWSRLREHSAALEKLVESEGDTVLRPARFEEEGRIANELREEGSRLRAQAFELEEKLKERKR